MKNDIIDLNALEKLICESKKKYGPFHTNNDSKIFWSAFYTIPTYHNPTGSVLPPGITIINIIIEFNINIMILN